MHLTKNESNTNKDKALSLYKYLREFCKIDSKLHINLKNYDWKLFFTEIPQNNENIFFSYKDRIQDNNENEENRFELLCVEKPLFDKCPTPPDIIINWLSEGWDDFNQEPKIKETNIENIENTEKQINEIIEKFDDNINRIMAYKNWSYKRKNWQEKQQTIKIARDLFNKLYKLHVMLNDENETKELVIANGFISLTDNKNINHPILSKRVYTEFDADNNKITIYDGNSDPELYVSLLSNLSQAPINAISEADQEVRDKFYHPLDRNETYDFFKNFIHRISSNSKFLNIGEIPTPNTDDKIFLSINPIFYLRDKIDGTQRVIEEIIQSIENGGTIPSHLCDLINGGKIEIPEVIKELTIDEKLAETGGESTEILLCKDANKEQLEIAKRIENYNAVLVQGPPGTGKTHTIANLLGHFLSQGKNVLVTSHTAKALKVLKEKVPKELQSLCVSVLDDKSRDVEKSINGINEYLSRENSIHIKKKIQDTELERKETIKKLADVRKKIFSIKNSEYKLITYNGESYSPSDIAKFIHENKDTLSYIPGEIADNITLPLTTEELLFLYESNKELSEYEEKELNLDFINPSCLISPTEFENIINTINDNKIKIKNIQEKLKSEQNYIFYNYENIKSKKSNYGRTFLFETININTVNEFQIFLNSFNTYEDWMLHAAVDGKKGGGYKKCWTDLIKYINETTTFSDSFVNDRLGKIITFAEDTFDFDLLSTLEKMEIKLRNNSKLSFFDELFNSSIKEVKEKIKINGEIIKNSQDCLLIINTIKLEDMRKKLSFLWDSLIGKHNYKKFNELDKQEPEQIAKNHILKIERYLNWYQNEYKQIQEYLSNIGFKKSSEVKQYLNYNYHFNENNKEFNELLKRLYGETSEINELDSEVSATRKIFEFTSKILPEILKLMQINYDSEMARKQLTKVKKEISCKNKEKSFDKIEQDSLIDEYRIIKIENDQIIKNKAKTKKRSELYTFIIQAIDNQDKEQYEKLYKEIIDLYNKIDLKQKRENLLEKLKQYAPDWAIAIEHRDGIFGENKIPVNISDAWKFKQFENIIKELHIENYENLQKKCFELSKIFKIQTSQLCEYKAWYYLLKLTESDLDIKQALTGWKTMMKKIGKGTGKNVPRYLKEAKRLMIKCQKAVPVWIMPISKALETLTPGVNCFDIIIIDEASQSNISSLAITYMAKKIIIVGDDKQVSPTAGFKEIDKINNLIDIHLKNIIPNPQTYEASTSLYDIAESTFTPVMLKEHFRSVPDIINFSNELSYDYKIKPLRDASSSNIQPAVINYRINGIRDNSKKINIEEAKCIASLITACIEREEYKNATFGVISLLGTEQAKVIRDILLEKIDNTKFEHHKITCGEPPNFQGDERDIIFLSMVDSNENDSPLHLMGIEGDRKRRYNVAVSRAKDQVWLIHSLDITKDLKEDDIRRKLISYTMNPNSYTQKLQKIEKKSDSLFEKEICQSLTARGYNIVQQFPVSSYRIDMVACYKNKKVAIECDGDKYHSGENKIYEDMERQNIIERITKFNFIRIRSSEYNLDKNKAIERIIKELNENNIYPETSIETLTAENCNYPSFIEDIKIRAQQIREEWEKENQKNEFSTFDND